MYILHIFSLLWAFSVAITSGQMFFAADDPIPDAAPPRPPRSMRSAIQESSGTIVHSDPDDKSEDMKSITDYLYKGIIRFPLSLSLKNFAKKFFFVCTHDEAKDSLLLFTKVSEFCSASLSGLSQYNQHWSYFYQSPDFCFSDVLRMAQHFAAVIDDMQRPETSEPPAQPRQIKTDRWCHSENWLWELDDAEVSETSQGGQDGVLQKIFSNSGIGATNRYYVEIGFNSKEFSGGSGSNTYQLYRLGWTGLLLDISNQNPAINLYRHKITASNVVQLFQQYGVPLEPDYVSIDIDSQDLWVLRSIISSREGFRPRVFSVEFNPNLPLGSTITLPLGANISFTGDMLFGAAAGAIKMVAEEFGYTVVHIINKLDIILIRTDLLQGACPVPFFSHYKKRARAHNCISEPERLNQWIDYKTWRDEGNEEEARAAALEQYILGMDEKTPAAETLKNELKCVGFAVNPLTYGPNV